MTKKAAFALCLLLLLTGIAEAKRGINASAAPSSVPMGAPSAVVHVTITNTFYYPPTPSSIIAMRFRVASDLYSLSFATQPPPGWIGEITSTAQGVNDQAEFFAINSSYYIPPNQSLTFDLIYTGKGGAAIPPGPSDSFDQFREIRATYEDEGNAFDEAGAGWYRRMMSPALTASPQYVVSGTNVTLNLTITNMGTTNISNIIPGNVSMATTGNASATKLSGPSPANVSSLAPNATTSFTWVYNVTGSGTGGSVVFQTYATANSGNYSTGSVSSNPVYVGNLIAVMSAPSQAVTGQNITITMRVTNPGTSALTNVRPSNLTASGNATLTSVSGPTPSSISSLSPGASVDFTWVYTINGSLGMTATLTGYATADGGLQSANSATGGTVILLYSVSVSPSTILSGQSNFTLTFTVYNAGADTIRRVRIDPQPCPPGGYTLNSSGHSSSMSGWTISTGGGHCSNPGQRITFTSPNASADIQSGGAGSFTVRYSGVGEVSVTTEDPFNVVILERGSDTDVQLSANVTRNVINITSMRITAPPSATDNNVSSGDWATVEVNVTNYANSSKSLTVTISSNAGDTFNTTSQVVNVGANSTASAYFNVTHFSVLEGWHVLTSTAYGTNIYVRGVTLDVWVSPVWGASINTTKADYSACSRIYYRCRLYNSSNSLINETFTVQVTDGAGTTRQEIPASPNNGTGVFLGNYSIDTTATPGSWFIKALIGPLVKGSAGVGVNP